MKITYKKPKFINFTEYLSVEMQMDRIQQIPNR